MLKTFVGIKMIGRQLISLKYSVVVVTHFPETCNRLQKLRAFLTVSEIYFKTTKTQLK